jgi:hypothetical protein
MKRLQKRKRSVWMKRLPTMIGQGVITPVKMNVEDEMIELEARAEQGYQREVLLEEPYLESRVVAAVAESIVRTSTCQGLNQRRSVSMEYHSTRTDAVSCIHTSSWHRRSSLVDGKYIILSAELVLPKLRKRMTMRAL